jgi:hypothetical protein
LPCLQSLQLDAHDPFMAASQLVGRGLHLTSLRLFTRWPGTGWAVAAQQLGMLPVLQQLVLRMPLASLRAAGPWLLQQPQLTSLDAMWNAPLAWKLPLDRLCLRQGVVRDGLPSAVAQMTRLRELRLSGPCTEQLLAWVTGLTQLSVLRLLDALGGRCADRGPVSVNPAAWKVLSRMPMLCRFEVDEECTLFKALRDAAPYLVRPMENSRFM